MNINKDNSLNSRISFSTLRSDDKTSLDERYFDIPYKLTHYGKRDIHNYLELIIMCASPGIMDGDVLTLDVLCQENSETKLFTQSYNKIHQMPKKIGAKQHCIYTLEKNAMFQYIPHPTIPYANSVFTAENTIEVTGSSHLIWGDIISGGRIHSGERFLLESYHTMTKVKRDGKLIFFDNQLIFPKQQPLEEMLFFEGYTHQGTLLLISPFANDLKKELDEILLAQFEDSAYGFTFCADNAVLLRVMGNSGDAIYEWLQSIGEMAWSFFSFHRKKAEENSDIKNDVAENTPVKNLKKKISKSKNTADVSANVTRKTAPKTKKNGTKALPDTKIISKKKK